VKSNLSKKLRRKNRARRLGYRRLGMQMEHLEHRRLLAGAGDFNAGIILPPGEGESDGGGGFRADQVVVRFRDGITDAEKQMLVDELGAQIAQEYPYVNSALLSLPSGVGVPLTVLRLSQDDRVSAASPNYVLEKTALLPNDTLFGLQWDKNNTAGLPGYVFDADIDAPEAWEQFGTGTSAPVIAVFDTGIDYGHEDLIANMWRNPGEIPNGIDDDGNGYVDDIYGWDFTDGDSDPMDEDGHGTHVSGIAGAVGNNGKGIAGVNWTVQLMAIRMLDGGGLSEAIAGMDYIIRMKTDYGVNIVVANHSWGIPDLRQSAVLEQAFNDGVAAGIVQVVSAGNDAENNDVAGSVPATMPVDGMIVVAATDPADELADFSNWGVQSVDIGAPGVEIMSTLPGNTYGYNQGTSMAAPQVSGAVALLKSIAPSLSVAESIDLIYQGADPVPDLAGRVTTGGRLNIWNSAKLLETSTLSGRLWADVDGDGVQDPMESGLTGWTVYIDANNNGDFDAGEDSVLSGDNGVWSISRFLDPGSYRVRVVPDPLFERTFPSESSYLVTIDTPGDDFDNLDFGFRGRPGEISGVKFNDINGNGVQDPGEPGISGVYIYADLDHSGTIALGEPAAITDSQGRYRLVGVPAATVNVREVLPPGWRQTAPGVPEYHAIDVKPGDVVTDVNFGNQRAVDFGDAPAPYPTNESDGGAWAGLLRGFGLGVLVDTEADGLPDDGALGDDNDNLDDEDGVNFPAQLYVGGTATIDVQISTGRNPAGVLQGWIDFNGDGDWNDPGEQVIADLSLAQGVYSLDIDIPDGAVVGTTFARFRYGYERGIGPTGGARAGEVEDYQIDIVPDKPTAVDDTFTVDQDTTFNTLPVLDNDFASSQGGLRIVPGSVTTPSQGGTVTVSANGQSLIYSPLPGFFSPPAETFQYTVTDNSGGTSTATVSVLVQATFTSPIAVDDVAYVEADSFVLIPVLENDVPGGLVIGPVSPPGSGTATVVGDAIRYTPGPNFSSVDQFQYQVIKGTETSTATVTVFETPEPPKDVTIYIDLLDDQGQPITEVTAGQEFQARVRVQDTRQPSDSKPGVAAIYLDLLFDRRYVATIPSTSNPFGFDIVFNNDAYDTLQSADATVPGLIDEVGAFQRGIDPLGSSAITVFTVGLRALQPTAPGEPVMFYGDPADAPQQLHDILLYNPPGQVTVDRVSYGTSSLVILPNGNANGQGTGTGNNQNGTGNPGSQDKFDVNQDGFLSPLDVLLVISYLNNGDGSGEGEGPSVDRMDINDDGVVTPLDALILISELNDRDAGGEGEANSAVPGNVTGSGASSAPLLASDASSDADSIRSYGDASSLDARDYLLQVGLPQSRRPQRDQWAGHHEDQLEDLLDDVAADIDQVWS